MMRVQELLKSVDAEALVRRHIALTEELTEKAAPPDAVRITRKALDGLVEAKIEPNDEYVLCAHALEESPLPDVFLVKAGNPALFEKEKTQFEETYSLMGWPLQSLLGFRVFDSAFEKFSPEQVADALFYELTFFGYDLSQADERMKKFLSSLAVDEEPHGPFSSVEEMIKSMEDDDGTV